MKLLKLLEKVDENESIKINYDNRYVYTTRWDGKLPVEFKDVKVKRVYSVDDTLHIHVK